MAAGSMANDGVGIIALAAAGEADAADAIDPTPFYLLPGFLFLF